MIFLRKILSLSSFTAKSKTYISYLLVFAATSIYATARLRTWRNSHTSQYTVIETEAAVSRELGPNTEIQS